MRQAVFAIVLHILLLAAGTCWAASDFDAVRARVSAWREAWRMKDIELFASCYHPAFRTGNYSIRKWIEHKSQLFNKAGILTVEIYGLSISIHGNQATARFIQRYTSEAYSDKGEKTLALEKLDGAWKIISEHWQKLPADFKLPEPVKKTVKPKRRIITIPAEKPAPKMEQLQLPKTPLSRKLEYRMDDGGGERVYIRMDRFFIPIVFNLEGKKPRVVIDIFDISQWDEPSRLPANGPLIRQIRTYLHRKQKKLRIVLDLNPSENYYISQRYFKGKNIYCIEIK